MSRTPLVTNGPAISRAPLSFLQRSNSLGSRRSGSSANRFNGLRLVSSFVLRANAVETAAHARARDTGLKPGANEGLQLSCAPVFAATPKYLSWCDQKRNHAVDLLSAGRPTVVSGLASAQDKALRGRNLSAA